MYLQQRALPSNRTNNIEVELTSLGYIHIKAIHLTLEEATSQIVLGVFGVLSVAIVSSLLFYLFSHVLYVGHGARKERAQSLKRFLATDMGVYLLCLLVSDLGMSMAAISDLTWAHEFIIRHNTLCNFQGVANQFGFSAAAYWNLCLATQTFLLLFVRYTPPTWAKWVVVPFGWVFAVLMTIIGPIMNTSPFSFYGPESSGCWLTIGSSNYKAWLLTAAYLSLCSLAIMAVLYIILFLSLSGALEKITNRQNSSTGRGSSSGAGRNSDAVPSSVTRGKQVRKVARKMLWFPLSYLLSLPLVICTLLAARGKILDHTVYIVSDLLFVCISVADVAIFVATRRHLLASSNNSPSTHGGGISMHVVTTTFNPPAALPNKRAQSPVDSLESEVESYKEAEREKKVRHAEAWESPAQQTKRGSTQLRSARSQGHEDSLGLVKLPGAAQSDDNFLTKIDSLDESRSSKVTLAKF